MSITSPVAIDDSVLFKGHKATIFCGKVISFDEESAMVSTGHDGLFKVYYYNIIYNEQTMDRMLDAMSEL